MLASFVLLTLSCVQSFGPPRNDPNGECLEWKYISGMPNAINKKLASGNDRRQLIEGGGESDLHEYPWQVRILWDGLICGGSIIGRSWILTAAHCKQSGKPTISAGLGEHKRNAKTIIVHENYVPESTGLPVLPPQNDIMLIELDEPLPCSNWKIRPVLLADKSNFNINDCSAWATGFGMLEQDTYIKNGKEYYESRKKGTHKVINEVQMRVFDTEACKRFKGTARNFDMTKTRKTYLCAFSPGIEEGICKGDSGGPLVIDIATSWKHIYAQVGVSSYTEVDCGTSPGFFADVSEYKGWILSKFSKAQFVKVKSCDKGKYLEGQPASCDRFSEDTGIDCWDLVPNGYVKSRSRCYGKKCTKEDTKRCCASASRTYCYKEDTCCLWGTTCWGCPNGGSSEFAYWSQCGSWRKCSSGRKCRFKPGQCCIAGSSCSGCPWGSEYANPSQCGSSRRCKLSP